MRASRGWLPAGALLLIAVAGAWWLLVGTDPSAASSVTAGAGARQSDGPAVLLPVAGTPGTVAQLVGVEDELPPAAGTDTPAVGGTSDAESPPGVPVTFTGRVVDSRGVPVAGAAVLCRGTATMREVFRAGAGKERPDLDFMPRALTDSAGRFTLESRYLPGPDWDWDGFYPVLIALGAGCAPRSVRCLGCMGGAFDAGDICIEPGGWLTGRVVGEWGAPVPGVRVWGHDLHEQPAACAITENDSVFDDQVSECASGLAGPDGRFRAGPFWPGTAGLKAEAPGYVDQIVAALPVDVGHEVDIGDVVMGRGRVLIGVVLTPDGTPVPGARVSVWRPYGSDMDEPADLVDKVALRQLRRFRDRELITDESGRFEMGGFESANHRIQVEARGFEWWQADNVLPGTGELRVELARAARLELQLIEDATSAPATGAVVTAGRRLREKEYGSVPLSARPSEEPGVFIIEPLGPGGTDVHVSAAGLGGTSLHVDALKPGVVERRTLRLVPALVVSGLVTAPDGTPLPSTDVVAEPLPADENAKVRQQDEPPPSVSVRTGADGRFTLSGLGPGRWSVKADRDDRVPSKQVITVEAAKQPEDMTLVLQPSCSLFGVLTDGQGQPKVGERIWARSPQDNDWPEVRSAVGGRYEFKDLVPGTWSLRYAPDEIVLAPGEARHLDLQDAMQTVLAGRVLLANGSPPARAVVYFCSRDEQAGLQRDPFPVQADGSFRNEWVEPGAYTLQALLDDGGGQSPIVSVIAVEHQTTTVDLRVGGERVRVHVTDQSSGQPAAGVRIVLLPALEDGEPVGSGRVKFNGERRNFGGATDAHGVAELGGLPPGRLRVMLPDPAFGPVSSEPIFAEVSAGEVADVEIAVVGYASVSGSIARSDGVPAPDGLYVMGFGKASDPPLSITSSGKYHLDELAPGSWRIVVSADWMEDVGSTYARRLVDMTVTLKPGEQLDLPLTISE